jgi:hypothetical protein
MKLNPKLKLFLAVGILGVLCGAFWALLVRGPETIPVLPTLSGPKLERKDESKKLPPASSEQVGRLDPFQSPLAKPSQEEPREEVPPKVFYPPPPASPPNPKPEPKVPSKSQLSWKLVGLGAGQQKLALVQKGGQVLMLREGEELDGWLLEEIQQRSVVFSRGKDKVTIPMEEVLTSETDR